MSLKLKIIELKSANPEWGYRTIAKKLGCDHNNVKYHLCEKTRGYFALRRRKNRRKQITELKMKHGGKCKICGYSKSLDALHFHHRDPATKIGGVRRMIYGASMRSAKTEAEKCDLLCANCHAEQHDKKLVPQAEVASAVT